MLQPSRKQTLSPLSMASNDSSFLQQYGNLAGNSPYDAAAGRSSHNSPPLGQYSNNYSPDGYGHSPTNRSPPSSRGPPSTYGGRASHMSTSSNFSAHAIYSPMSDSGRPFNPRMEETLIDHYQVLKGYLQPHLTQDAAAKSSRARDKLLRLSPTQFHELSTDVYDELLRREDERMRRRPDVPPYLLPTNSFHPKRNQARQKLSTLPPDRFRQLATDVYYELERRVPRLGGSGISRAPSPAMSTASSSYRGPPRGPPPGMRGPPPAGYRGPPPAGNRGPGQQGPQHFPTRSSSHDYGKPLPKTFQSNTIVPNKSTMVEGDDTDDEGGMLDSVLAAGISQRTSVDQEKIRGLEAQVAEMQQKLQSMEVTAGEKDTEISSLETTHRAAMAAERDTWNKAKDEMERRLREHEEKATEYGKREVDLRSQLASVPADTGSEWRERCERLEQQMLEQQRTTDEVRRDAAGFLSEMRALSLQSEGVLEREEQLRAQISSLESDVNEWRRRYAKAKTELRTLKASSIGLSLQNMVGDTLSARQDALSRDGIVHDVDVTNFQMAIDELLQCARSAPAETILEKMKLVITHVQQMTANTKDEYTGLPSPAASPDPMSPQIGSTEHSAATLKTRVARNATGLITATRNYVSANGMSPVSLVDAAAANLTAAVIDYVKTVGIKASTSTALQHDSGIDDGYETLPASVHRPKSIKTKPLPPAPGQNGVHGGWYNRLKGSIDSTTSSSAGPNGYHNHDRDSQYSDYR